MSDIVKTLIFVSVGAVLITGATVVHFASQPATIDQFALVGEEFYPDFDSPNEATFLEVSAFDFEKRKQRNFRVEFSDGKWRIPSHFDYPAEAADRLSRTAASIMGIRRQALAGRRANEHKRFGVVDPIGDEAEKVNKSDSDAVGIRVTIGKKDEDVLADYIIGKEVEAKDELEDEQLREIRGLAPSTPLHYVRRPDEVETYVAAISVDASTKFEDWIEPDLLVLDGNTLREVVVNDYRFETRIEEVEVVPNSGLYRQVKRLERVAGEQFTLTKDSDFGSWTLVGIDEATEEMDTSKITRLTSALDRLVIRGVRPRLKIDGFSILTPELKLEFPESIRSQDQALDAIDSIARDLESKGFNLMQDPQDRSFAIGSDRGELTIATNEGLVYHLYFGDVVIGDEAEIELGITSDDETGNGEETGNGNGDSDSGDSDSPADGQDPDSTGDNEGAADGDANGEATDDLDEDESKNRYLLVRVSFDPRHIGDAPTPPVEPTPPDPGSTDDGQGDGAGSDEHSTGSGDGNNNSGTDGGAADSSDDCLGVEFDAIQDDASQDGADQDDASQDDASQDDSNRQSDDGQTGNDQSIDETPETNTGGESQDNVVDDGGVGGQDPVVPELDPQIQYQQALIQYEADKTAYEEALFEYEDKLSAGQTKVGQLNDRFSDWFYLISAEDLDTLKLSRTDLVSRKEVETPPIEPIVIPSLEDDPPMDLDDSATGANDDGSVDDSSDDTGDGNSDGGNTGDGDVGDGNF